MTVFFPPEKRTRAPAELGRSPSMPTRMPALISSSLNLLISVGPFSSGSFPASLSLFAFTMTITRMALSLGRLGNIALYHRDERGGAESTRDSQSCLAPPASGYLPRGMETALASRRKLPPGSNGLPLLGETLSF